MAFNPRWAFNIETVGIATIVLSLAVVAVTPIFRLVNATGRTSKSLRQHKSLSQEVRP